MKGPAEPAPFGVAALARVIDDGAKDVRAKVVTIYVVLIATTLIAWALALAAFSTRPLLLGTALVAYGFGLRHAVDADHISAIDNVTRKLMQDGQRPVAVGFFFSLGHSTIVILLTIAIAVGAGVVKSTMPNLENVGGLIGTAISAAFLFAIAAINVVVFLDVYEAFRRVRRGGAYNEEAVNAFLADRGLLGRFFRPLMKVVSKSWHMYPIGVLFGLGFDTATEVGLLGIAAVQGGNGLPIYDILIFPLLFTAGMSLLDTTDGILMLGAYGWAYVKPVRKLFYNMTITLVSIAVALIVGAIEALSIVAAQLHLSGGVWDGLANLSGNFGALGFAIIGVFLASWAVSTLIYKLRRYDESNHPAPTDITT
ncbi:MAG: HoxN/HupN/NixA family nickel/cobalt transporter [Vulcanimicrobiaceae bacterium]